MGRKREIRRCDRAEEPAPPPAADASRARVGLADAVVANRMLLWGASYLLIALGFGVFAWGTVSPGGVNAPAVVLPLAACGLGAATAMTLAFFPPAFYRRWLARQAGPAAR